MRPAPQKTPRRRPDPTITLINVVFLMLTFFLIAGTLAPSLPDKVRLVRLAEVDPINAPDLLALDAEGRILWQGREATPQEYAATLTRVGIARILPDRDAPAAAVVAVARDLRDAGATDVRLMTERGVP
jgi:biopolymer transport protein ExbD